MVKQRAPQNKPRWLSAFVRAILVAGWCAAFSLSPIYAQYVPDFSTFTPNFTLSGQKDSDVPDYRWQTNDVSQANYIGVIYGYSQTLTDYWASLGGLTRLAPSERNVDLFRNFSLPSDCNHAVFDVKFSITESKTPWVTRDAFAWKFRTPEGTNIVSLDFEPISDSPALKLYWTDCNGVKTPTTFGIGYNSIYSLHAVVSGLATHAPVFSVSLTDSLGTTSNVIQTALPGNSPETIGQVAASWTLSGPSVSDYGFNSLLFSGYSVVPEPAISSLVILGGIGFFGFAVLKRLTAVKK